MSSRRPHWPAAILLAALCILPATTAGAVAVEGNDVIVVEAGRVVEDDLYLFGDTIRISGTVAGDVVAAGREIIIDGTIEGSLLAMGQNVAFNGAVSGSARLAGNTVFAGGVIRRDLLAAGNSVSVTGKVSRDYYGAANNSTVTGSLGRNLRGAFSRLDVNSDVGGGLKVQVDRLALGSGARIAGGVEYTSANEAIVDPQAVIGGAIKKFEPAADERPAATPLRRVWSFLRPLLSLLLVTVLMVLMFPRAMAGTAKTIAARPVASLGYGALAVFVTPFAAIFLLVTIIGAPLSILAGLVYLIFLYLTRVFAGYFLASFALEKWGRAWHPLWMGLAGVTVLTLAVKIPYIGWLIHLAAVLFAAGALIVYIFMFVRERRTAA